MSTEGCAQLNLSAFLHRLPGEDNCNSGPTR
jgi:hypothetical protein